MVSKHLVFSKKHAEFHSIILQVVWNLLSLGFCFCKSALVKMIKYLQLLNTNLSSIYSFYNYGKHHFMSFIWNFYLLEIVSKLNELVVTNCNLKACFKILIYFCLRRNLEEVKQEVESCNNTSSNWFACYSHISAR